MAGFKRQRLDRLLLVRGLAGSRHQAAGLITADRVRVNGRTIRKPGQMVNSQAALAVTLGPTYVSRAALKLESVTDRLKLEFKGKIVLDVGASTGGFSDFALQKGAKRVYAVDVGTDQLNPKLRANPRVVSMEKTDIRQVGSLPAPVDLALVDVSFISLKLVLPGLIQLLSPAGLILAMAKPQFETDGSTAELNRGVIKNDAIRRTILKGVEDWIKNYFEIVGKADSGLAGAKGNLERFYLLKQLKH